MTYDPKAIANFFIEAAAVEGKRLTPIQVIKLVYVAHGWHLGLTGQPLINEPPEAWKYGPVVRSLYHTLKRYGDEEIDEPITKTGFIPGMSRSFPNTVVSPPREPATVDFLRSVWNAYKSFSGFQLSAMTHQPGTPWQKTWDEAGAKYEKGVQIPDYLIEEHYRNLRKERTKAPPC